MDEDSSQKTRRERRKEARLSKNKKKFDSWVQHQKSWKGKQSPTNLKSDEVWKLQEDEQQERNSGVSLGPSNKETESSFEEHQIQEKSGVELRDSKIKNGLTKSKKTKFSEYLELEMKGGELSAKEDLKLERKLAKKLKVKNGMLQGADDDIDRLLEGIPSILSNLEDNEGIERGFEEGIMHKKRRKSNLENTESKGEELIHGVDDTLDATSDEHSYVEEMVLQKDSKKRNRKKSKFEKYLETEMQGGVASGAADLALEKNLGKELKVKKGRLSGEDDDINMLFEGIPSVLDSSEDEQITSDEDPQKSLKNSYLGEKNKKKKSTDQEKRDGKTVHSFDDVSRSVQFCVAEGASGKASNVVPAKYVAPHLRSRSGNESEEHAQVRRRIRGLLNKLSESNVESITSEISRILESVCRSVGYEIVQEEVVAACSGGPRGNEQFAAVFAAFVAGMACLLGMDFGAKLLARVAKCYEEEYLEEDNLSLRNLTLFLSYLYIFGVSSSELVYDFLITISKRLTEVDVSTILTVMQTCGMQLRGDDPVGMKDFIFNVQSRASEMKTCSGDGQSNKISKRMEFMLQMICDIKNNKKKPKEDVVQHTRIKKWLQKLRVDDILIRGLKWSKLLDSNKKGQWWLSGDVASSRHNIQEVASTIGREVPETQKMLQLAAAQRMNTDARRAIFCVIMSGEDYIDAFEKLLRLDLPGKQDREIMRVLVECCLQEKVFNKYYCVLASKLCNHDKNHKFTLQYRLWDHFKELDSMSLQRSMHLSKFVAEMVASFTLSLAVLKVVDLTDPIQLTPKRIMHFRMLFEAILAFPDKLVWNVFTRIALIPDYESLRNGIDFFISKHLLSLNKSLANKFKLAKKALSNVEGVLM